MLGKLLKHEFKTTSKMIVPLYLVIVVITIFARIAAQSMVVDSSFTETTAFGIFAVLTMMVYVLGLFAICIATFIYLILRFYKNLFSDEGYLMHTLPVSSWELLASKLIVSFCWFLAELLLIILSIFCIFANSEMFDAMADLFNSYNGFAGLIHFFTGLNLIPFWILVTVSLIFGLLSSMLRPYVSICIGQLWQQHKIAGAFLTYFIISIVLQIASTIFTGFFMNSNTLSVTAGDLEASSFVPLNYYYFSLGLSVVLSVIYFAVCGFIMKKKVNLD